MSRLWVPDSEQIVKRPFYYANALALVLGRCRQRAKCDIGPVLALIEVEELQIADKYRQVRWTRPLQRLWARWPWSSHGVDEQREPRRCGVNKSR